MKIRKSTIAAAALLAVSAAGCTQVPGAADHEQAAGKVKTEKVADETKAPAGFECNDGTHSNARHKQGACSGHGGVVGDTPPPAPKDLKWGESFVYNDGIEITVSQERMKRPHGDSWASLAEFDDEVKKHLADGDVPVKFTLQVRNTSKANFDPTSANIDVLAGEDQLDASCIDSDCGIDLSILRPGKNVKGTYMYWIPKAKANDVTVEATAGYNKDFDQYEPTLFVGSVK